MKYEWYSCDGKGHLADESPRPIGIVSRRSVLMGAGMALMAWAGRKTALADVAIHPGDRKHGILVNIFLRGGADGLNLVVPHGEAAYYRARPSVAIGTPKSGLKGRAIDLDGFFGLHPALAPWKPLYDERELAVVTACGSGDRTRSHFEAMSAVERGASHENAGPSSGWIARHLATTESEKDTPLRAVAFADTMPDSLRGATHAIALRSLTEFRLSGDAGFHDGLASLYAEGPDEVAHAGRQTLHVLDALKRIDPAAYRPQNGAKYPDSDLGAGLRQVACLIRSGLGLEVASLDKGNWDTHVAQGSDTGWLALLLDDLAKSVAAFTSDMGAEMGGVTVVVMTEFGRRLAENSGLGTDHGRAAPMFVFGGGVQGGHIYGKWPGLAPEQLDTIGDVKVTTDYRTVLGEVLAKRMGNPRIEEVFPGGPSGRLGLFGS